MMNMMAVSATFWQVKSLKCLGIEISPTCNMSANQASQIIALMQSREPAAIRIILADGKYADLESFTAADVDVDVIATSLANQCRFGGQCHTFYSVAQHCVHAATLAMEDGHDTETVFAILMHDAAEAYVRDVVTPFKVKVPLFTKVERSVLAVIKERFGIDFVEHSHWIKYYDSMMLRTEKEFFWPLDQERWDAIDYDIPAAGLRHLCPLLPAAAKNDFLRMYRSVQAKRKGVVAA